MPLHNQQTCLVQEAQIPEDKGSFSVFTSELPDTVLERGRTLLEAPESDRDWQLFGLAKRFYRSCMSVDRLQELGVTPLLDSLGDHSHMTTANDKCFFLLSTRSSPISSPKYIYRVTAINVTWKGRVGRAA